MPSDESAVFYRAPGRHYPTAVRGEGVCLYDSEGKRYLDASGGAVVVTIGHGVREIAAAAAAQLERLSFSHSSQFTNPAQEELARRMAALSPGGNYRLIPYTGGSEAVESALKLARQYHLERGAGGKHIVIARWQSFHGATLGALAASGFHARRKKFLPMLPHSEHIAPCHCYACPFGKTYPECGVECAADLERAIERLGAERVAAFISEPIVGAAAGATVPPPEYFAMIRDICDRHDVLFIADEVMTGVGRTGKPFAIEHWGVAPDIIVAGKGMASGYAPLAGILVSERVYRSVREGSGAFSHGHTYQGNPLACAVGAAVLRHLEDHGLIARCARMGEHLFAALAPLKDHPLVGEVRGKGLFAGLQFVRDPETRKPFPREARVAERVGEEAFRRGLILYPGTGSADSEEGDHVLVAPPFVITEEEIAEAASLLHAALDTVYEDLQENTR